MFLGVTASVTNWDADGTCCSIVLEDNPLVDFVELPDNCQGLYYCNILSGVIRGALDMVSFCSYLLICYINCFNILEFQFIKYQLYFSFLFSLLTLGKLGKYNSLITASFLCGLLKFEYFLKREIDCSYVFLCIALAVHGRAFFYINFCFELLFLFYINYLVFYECNFYTFPFVEKKKVIV